MGTATKALLVTLLASGVVAGAAALGLRLDQGAVEAVITETVPVLAPAEPEDSHYGEARVIDIVDGDTIVVTMAGREETVRLLGVDTPETAYANGGVAACYATEATSGLRELLTGEIVLLTGDVSQATRDTYGRLLAYVTVGEQDVGEWLLANGYAKEYTFRGLAYEKQAMYRSVEATAKQAKEGRWGVCL